jgi:large subunit ribosomal protein L25
LPIAAKPAAIPTKIELDVSKLKIGEALHVSDLKLAAGLRALLEPKAGLASVVAPRADKVEEAAAAAPAEGAAAAAPAAGEAKKEGAAAAGDKKGAAAPAAAKEEKKGK